MVVHGSVSCKWLNMYLDLCNLPTHSNLPTNMLLYVTSKLSM